MTQSEKSTTCKEKTRAAFKSRKQNQPLKPKKNFCDVKREISSIPSEISNSVTKKDKLAFRRSTFK